MIIIIISCVLREEMDASVDGSSSPDGDKSLTQAYRHDRCSSMGDSALGDLIFTVKPS